MVEVVVLTAETNMSVMLLSVGPVPEVDVIDDVDMDNVAVNLCVGVIETGCSTE